MNFTANLDAVVAALDKHLATRTVVGEAVTFGDVTMIPVMDLMFGFGGGGGEGKDADKGGVGGGAGAGARLAPKAVIVIKGGDVQVMPLTKGSAIEKIVESLPALLEKVKVEKKEKAAE